MVYAALVPLMRTPRLPAVDRTDAPTDLNGLVRFAERRSLVSGRVPSHFKRSLLFTDIPGETATSTLTVDEETKVEENQNDMGTGETGTTQPPLLIPSRLGWLQVLRCIFYVPWIVDRMCDEM
jgi:hypothetical protein